MEHPVKYILNKNTKIGIGRQIQVVSLSNLKMFWKQFMAIC